MYEEDGYVVDSFEHCKNRTIKSFHFSNSGSDVWTLLFSTLAE